MSDKDGELSQKEIEDIVTSILNMRASGMTRRQIVEQFVSAGVDEAQAKEIVKSVLESQRRAEAQASGGGGVPGWLVMIGIYILINCFTIPFLGFIIF